MPVNVPPPAPESVSESVSESVPEKNWAGNHTYRFRLVRPTSLDELRAVVAAEPRVRPLGSRHTFNGLSDGDVAVSLSGLPGEITVDAEARTVTVGGAATYGAVAAGLAGHGLALHNLASLPHISVAGAVATGTHGSGDANGNLATAVAALEIVTATGDLVTVRRGDPGFDGAVVSLGALGVVNRVTLDVEPAYDVAQRVHEGLGWESLSTHFDAIMASGYSVSVLTDWGDQGSRVWVKSRRPTDGATDSPPDAPTELFGARAATSESHPLPGLDPVNCTPQLGSWGSWADRLPHFRMGFVPSNGEEIQSEYHLPRSHATQAIEALRGLAGELRPLLLVSEIRTVRGDDLWLSPNHDRDTVSFHFTWVRDQPAVEVALAAVEAALQPFAPRPHWGKLFLRGATGASAYQRLPDFVELRDAWDPDGKFTNGWLLAHLLLPSNGGSR